MNAPPLAPLRPPETVMRLSRLGAFHATRLSFMRTLIRLLAEERVRVERPVWDMSDEGYGRAVYSLRLMGRTYSLVALSNPLADEDRTDRVIAEAWDSAYVLYDGMPDAAELDRIAAQAPLQEAGRFTERDLILSRANKSVRLFAHVVEALAAGRQPDRAMIRDIGYLMRTTAVYGNGKFGIADRHDYDEREEAAPPFRLEMLTVWLIRAFTLDLAEHVAARRRPGAARLAPDLRRHLGVGNSTGLGMAPFLINHPVLVNNWILARETALARVLAHGPDEAARARLAALAPRVTRHLDEWRVDDEIQTARIETLRTEFAALDQNTPDWRALVGASAGLSEECQELVVSLLIEAHPDLVDDLAASMGAAPSPRPDFSVSTADLNAQIKARYHWALTYDFSQRAETARFWYVSADKQEPRLGERWEEPGAERESPLDIARQIQALSAALDRRESVGALVARRPELRRIAGRVAQGAPHRYAEIQDNLISAAMRPIDLLRCKLSFFGASKFDPRSDRWTRVTLFQGAPGPEELGPDADDWAFPALGA